MRSTIALILGGGRGNRLHPLTQQRAKPAVGVAGKYRLIDVTVSNCINSGLRRIYVLTQFLSASLHRHIMQTYRFDAFSEGFIEILAAEQSQQRETWYQGTADAVREALHHVLSRRPETILILAGDHLYRMDYHELVRHHRERNADVTVAVQPAPIEDASRYGLLRMAPDGRVEDYSEKPDDPAVIERFRAPADILERCHLDPREPRCLASMGIYAFRPQALLDLLQDPARLDFGQQVIPAAVRQSRVAAFPFSGYWRDIGTIRAFFEAHMEMVRPDPPYRVYEPGWPTFTRARHLAPARVMQSDVRNCLVAEGADVDGALISDSIIGVRAVVRDGARLKRVVLIGADFYEDEQPAPPGSPPLGVGMDAVIEQAIIDKDARIGDGVVITPKAFGVDLDGDGYMVRDGITVIPKGAIIPPGTRI